MVDISYGRDDVPGLRDQLIKETLSRLQCPQSAADLTKHCLHVVHRRMFIYGKLDIGQYRRCHSTEACQILRDITNLCTGEKSNPGPKIVTPLSERLRLIA